MQQARRARAPADAAGRRGGVVDLQALGLDYFRLDGNQIEIGAMRRMQSLANEPNLASTLKRLILTEYPGNLRQMATLGGEIAVCDGRSALATALLAMDAQLFWQPGDTQLSLGNFLPVRSGFTQGKLISQIRIPSQGELITEKVARSPGDLPILAISVFRWPSGRVRVALGGFGKAPILALDGPDAKGAEIAVMGACQHADDEWASGEYRSQVASQLVSRMVGSFAAG